MDPVKIENNKLYSPDGITVISNSGKIIAFDEAARRITGYNEDDVSLRHFSILFNQKTADRQFIEKSLHEGQSFTNIRVTLNCKNNRSIRVFASVTPIKKSTKKIVSVVFIFRDADEMIKLADSLQVKVRETIDEKNRFENIFHGVSEGIFTIDRNWIITSFNRSAEKITGYAREEAKGRKCWEIFKSVVCRNGCHMETTLKKKKTMLNNELMIERKNGSHIPIRVNSKCFRDAEGKCIGGIETFQDISEIRNMSRHLEERYGFEKMIGKSKVMQNIYTLLEHVAQADSTVLITGESGTGKELVARAIHLNSSRQRQPFLAVNCSAFVETLLESELFGHEQGAFTGAIKSKPGRFELAQSGTLFLDEIGDISPQVQVKLLRVLETRQFERVGGTKTIEMKARIIVATNKNLKYEIENKRFREDLFYRINVVNIHLPPLRERVDDLPLLIDHFLQKFSKKFKKKINSISPDALHTLNLYHWPGNIRELENVMEHIFVLCNKNTIDRECLPEWLIQSTLEAYSAEKPSNISESIRDAEKNHIESILLKYHGNRARVAEKLGIDKSTLWRKMKKYKLLKSN